LPVRDPQYFLETSRLVFRPWRVDDLDLALGLWGDPAVTRWITARGVLSKSDIERRLADEIELQRRHGMQYWPVFLLDDGAHVGCCGLRPYDPAHGVFELGVHLRPAFWGRGLAVEATRAVIAHAFGTLHAEALFAGHHPENSASRGLLVKLGFRYTHDELYEPTGLLHPSYRLESTL